MTDYKTFYEYMKTYDTEDLENIAEHGCINGCASGLIYYSDTVAFYDLFCDELHEKLGEWIKETGDVPRFITEQLDYATGFKNAMVWFVAEQYAHEILQTKQCETEDD